MRVFLLHRIVLISAMYAHATSCTTHIPSATLNLVGASLTPTHSHSTLASINTIHYPQAVSRAVTLASFVQLLYSAPWHVPSHEQQMRMCIRSIHTFLLFIVQISFITTCRRKANIKRMFTQYCTTFHICHIYSVSCRGLRVRVVLVVMTAKHIHTRGVHYLLAACTKA